MVLLLIEGNMKCIILLELVKEEEAKAALVIPDEVLISDYYSIRKQLTDLRNDFREVITHPSYSLPFLQPGSTERA